MKTIVLLVLCSFKFLSATAQKDTTLYGYIDSTTFRQTEIPPCFPGGPRSWNMYLKQNLNYLESAIDNSIKGVVTVEFTVELNGKTKKINIVKAVDPDLDKEVIRLIK